MGIFDLFRRSEPPSAGAPARDELGVRAEAYSLRDPRLIEFLRLGEDAITGQAFSVERALRNPSMFRAWSLISSAIGMLPMHLIDLETKEKARDHPVFKLLHRRPNGYQSAFDFKSLMQGRALAHGNGFARIVRSPDVRTRRKRVTALLPLPSERVTPVLRTDGDAEYRYDPVSGGRQILAARDVFHLRGVSLDGLNGISLIRQARDAISVALAAELATGRMMKNGTMVGGALKHPGRLSVEAHGRLKESLSEKEGAENAGKNLILEEGMDFTNYGTTAKDAQMTELRKLQVEEIARVTGVPRPLLMVDETSWGSGIEALGQFFVAYALNPWFEAWQQAAERSLLDEDEQDRYAIKVNPGVLLRGSLKDQADYLAKALGAGGHQPWLYADEARDTMDLPERDDPPHLMSGGAMAGNSDASLQPAKPAKTKSEDEDDDA